MPVAQNQIDHEAYQKKVISMTIAQLKWTIADCKEALALNPNGEKSSYYADEICYCSSELYRRQLA